MIALALAGNCVGFDANGLAGLGSYSGEAVDFHPPSKEARATLPKPIPHLPKKWRRVTADVIERAGFTGVTNTLDFNSRRTLINANHRIWITVLWRDFERLHPEPSSSGGVESASRKRLASKLAHSIVQGGKEQVH